MTIKKFFAPSTTRLGRQQWFRSVWQRLTMVLMLVMLTTATGSEAWSMQIFVHRMLTDKTITLEVESTDSHEAIKEKIREKAEIDPANQWLVYGDTKLYDGKTLSDYNIQAESTIKLYETSVTNGFCGIETMNGGANVSWTYDESLHTLTIGGDGPMMYYNSVLNGDQSYSNGAPWRAYAGEVKSVVIEDGITYVGSNTFAHCPNISSVTLPTDQHLYEIGPGAFGDCTSLTSIDIPMSVNKINDGAFAGCSNLASVTLGYGDGATFTIGTDVFPATTTIIVPAVALQSYLQASSWCAYADKVISTGYCGKDNTETTDVDESRNLIWTLAKNTGDQIEGNVPLTLTISKNPEVTAEGADFSMADGWPFDDGDGGVDEVTTALSITQAVIGEGVTGIGARAFQNCWNMATVSIPSTVTSIGTGAFLECKSLTSNITIPDGVTVINNSTFNGCEKLTTVVLPSGLTTIGASAFAGCYKLESIGVAGSTTNALPTSLTAIGTSAFTFSGLPAITLNEGLKTIDDGAFSSSKLTTINIPASVENIGEDAFTCNYLESISVADGNTHFITDGNGSFPFIRTLVYLYLHALHPGEIFNTDSIALPGSEIPAEEEEDDPYPSALLPEEPIVTAKLPEKILRLDDLYNARGDRAGHTSFRLSIKQKELMNYISMVDGSPATFIASVMYKAIVQLHPDSHLPVVCGMQHQFRKALRKPYSHMCHVNIVPMILPERLRDKDIETINTMLRGMLILRASDENDILTINEHIRNELRIKDMTLEEKHRCMRNVLLDGIGENTFEVSYTGRVPWCGTDKYIENVSPYLDIALSGGLSIEIFSVRDRFDINIMQSTTDTRYFDRFCKLLTSYSIGYTAEGASHYEICGHILP